MLEIFLIEIYECYCMINIYLKFTAIQKQMLFIPILLQFSRLPLNWCLHVSMHMWLRFQLLLFLPLLPSVDLSQLLQSSTKYRKEQR